MVIPFNIVNWDLTTHGCGVKHHVKVADLNDKPPTKSVVIVSLNIIIIFLVVVNIMIVVIITIIIIIIIVILVV